MQLGLILIIKFIKNLDDREHKTKKSGDPSRTSRFKYEHEKFYYYPTTALQ